MHLFSCALQRIKVKLNVDVKNNIKNYNLDKKTAVSKNDDSELA